MDNNENNNLIKNDSLFNSYSKIKLFLITKNFLWTFLICASIFVTGFVYSVFFLSNPYMNFLSNPHIDLSANQMLVLFKEYSIITTTNFVLSVILIIFINTIFNWKRTPLALISRIILSIFVMWLITITYGVAFIVIISLIKYFDHRNNKGKPLITYTQIIEQDIKSRPM